MTATTLNPQAAWPLRTEEPKNIRYMHIRRPLLQLGRSEVKGTISALGGITAAYVKLADNQYKVAFARCNAKNGDHYQKLEGRHRAVERLLEDDDVWMLDLAANTNIYIQLLELALNIKEFRRALRPEVRR